MAFALPLQPGGVLDVHPLGGGWRIAQGVETLGRLTASASEGTTITTPDGVMWTVSGSVVPLELTLWDERDGAGAAWCQGRTLRRGADVQVAGAELDLEVHQHLTGGLTITAADGDVAELAPKHTRDGLALRFTLAERIDVARYAPGIALVAAWRAAAELTPVLNPGAGFIA